MLPLPSVPKDSHYMRESATNARIIVCGMAHTVYDRRKYRLRLLGINVIRDFSWLERNVYPVRNSLAGMERTV